jgi:hypothetical protein
VPGAGLALRSRKLPQAHFADAGYVLVTASTKQRTMRGVVEPNDVLFAQSTYLSAAVLCRPAAVAFLQLNYLLAPAATDCDGWRVVMPPLTLDDWLVLHGTGSVDTRVRALSSAAISDAVRHEPAFSAGSSLLAMLTPLAGTSVTLGPRDVVIRQEQPSIHGALTLLFPVAYDSAWQSSSGRIENIGGLVALTGANDRRIVLSFSPDMTSMSRVGAVILAQLFTCLGLIGMTGIAPVVTSSALRLNVSARRQLTEVVLRPVSSCSRPSVRTFGCHEAASVQTCCMPATALWMFFTLQWHRKRWHKTSLAPRRLFPFSAMTISVLVRSERAHNGRDGYWPSQC